MGPSDYGPKSQKTRANSTSSPLSHFSQALCHNSGKLTQDKMELSQDIIFSFPIEFEDRFKWLSVYADEGREAWA